MVAPVLVQWASVSLDEGPRRRPRSHDLSKALELRDTVAGLSIVDPGNLIGGGGDECCFTSCFHKPRVGNVGPVIIIAEAA